MSRLETRAVKSRPRRRVRWVPPMCHLWGHGVLLHCEMASWNLLTELDAVAAGVGDAAAPGAGPGTSELDRSAMVSWLLDETTGDSDMPSAGVRRAASTSMSNNGCWRRVGWWLDVSPCCVRVGGFSGNNCCRLQVSRSVFSASNADGSTLSGRRSRAKADLRACGWLSGSNIPRCGSGLQGSTDC